MTVAPKQETSASISEVLAEWAATLNEDSLPPEVRRAVADTVLDTVALSIASVNTDYGQAVLAAADVPGDCTVFGDSQTRSSLDAALINGTRGHGEDFDNTYEGCPVHSGV
ncbi:MAG: MmgE/PrpD family protein, partial [Natronospirillum sp.]